MSDHFLPASGWRITAAGEDEICTCPDERAHWLNNSGEAWPQRCSVFGCLSEPVAGALIHNASVPDVQVIPVCEQHRHSVEEFALRLGASLIAAGPSGRCVGA